MANSEGDWKNGDRFDGVEGVGDRHLLECGSGAGGGVIESIGEAVEELAGC